METRLAHLTLKEVRDNAPYEVAVLPWGSYEPHGMHLTYGCDTLVIDKLSEVGCRKAKEKGASVVQLPTIPLGTNSNFFAFPMALHFSPTTQLAIIKDIARAMDAHKVYKLVIVNGHGGNEFRALLRELYGLTKAHIFLIEAYSLMTDVINEICDDKSGEHANESETSILMHIFPEHVHMEWADDGRTRQPRLASMKKGRLWMVRPWHLLTKNSTYGNPRKATAEKGKILFEKCTDRLAEIMVELSAAKLDKTFPYEE